MRAVRQPSRFPRLLALAVPALGAVLFLWTALAGSREVGVTFDEPGHIVSGYAYWKTSDFRINAENGVLSSRIAALPLLAMDLNFAADRSPGWARPNGRVLGWAFFYESGNDFLRMLFASRMAVALVAAVTVWLVGRWAAGLFGLAGGVVAAVLCALSPTMLAHGGLATSDVTLTFFLLLAVTAVWRLWHVMTPWRLAAAILACSAALLAKMSGVLLIPILALLLALRWWHGAPVVWRLGGKVRLLRDGRARAALLLSVPALAFGCWAGIWAAYDFRYSATPAGAQPGLRFQVDWPELLEGRPPQRDVLAGGAAALVTDRLAPPAPSPLVGLLMRARDSRLLPEAYLWGTTFTFQGARERASFFLGECSRTGWKSFFPVAFLLKSTPVELLLFLGTLGGGLFCWLRPHPLDPGCRSRRRRRLLYRAAPLAVLFVVYWSVAIGSGLNIGHRHLLPIYPVVFVLAAGSVVLLRRASRVVRAAIVPLLVWHAADAFAVHPNYLSYFTPVTGGAERGWRYLADSSFDWGQGLPAFAAWRQELRRSGDTSPVFLTYFGSDSTRARGIEATRFGDWGDDIGPRNFPAPLRGGWYAISATHLHGIYLGLCGPWTAELDQRYTETWKLLPRDAAAAARLTEQERAVWRANAMLFEVLQFGRVSHFLRHRQPHAIAGGILIYKVSDADLSFAVSAPFEEFTRRITPSPGPR